MTQGCTCSLPEPENPFDSSTKYPTCRKCKAWIFDDKPRPSASASLARHRALLAATVPLMVFDGVEYRRPSMPLPGPSKAKREERKRTKKARKAGRRTRS